MCVSGHSFYSLPLARPFYLFLLLALTGCGGDGRADNITFAPGLHFRPETDEDSFWVGFSAAPCEFGKPATNYVEATDWGIMGAGLTAVVDRCAAHLGRLRISCAVSRPVGSTCGG